jgi:hypothetical protein
MADLRRQQHKAEERPSRTPHTASQSTNAVAARLAAFRGVINVGRSLVLKTLAPCEGDRLRIRRPGEFADIETVVLCVRCDRARFRAMGGVCY